ncbi:hypothetical protein BDV3_002993 [Batrachochytrium dendrobatidis]
MSGKSVIVMFKDDTPKDVIDKAAADVVKQGGVIGHRYHDTILGFSATMPANFINTLENHECVESIEADGQVHTLTSSS